MMFLDAIKKMMGNVAARVATAVGIPSVAAAEAAEKAHAEELKKKLSGLPLSEMPNLLYEDAKNALNRNMKSALLENMIGLPEAEPEQSTSFISIFFKALRKSIPVLVSGLTSIFAKLIDGILNVFGVKPEIKTGVHQVVDELEPEVVKILSGKGEEGDAEKIRDKLTKSTETALASFVIDMIGVKPPLVYTPAAALASAETGSPVIDVAPDAAATARLGLG